MYQVLGTFEKLCISTHYDKTICERVLFFD